MENKIIITIGRQFGSGGRDIGRKLADVLGIPFYDKELLVIAAQESGLSTEVFEKADEQTSKGFSSYSLPMSFSYMGVFMPSNDALSNERLFELQSNAIRKIADNGSCVLVGRCADYVLRDNQACQSFFVHGDTATRIRRIAQRQQITEKQAEDIMNKIDKSRAAYYNYYTDKVWGAATSYDLSINASLLGIDETVDYIKAFVEKRSQK
ncbi:MAG: cytidylate kinase-like family protein [Prevotellaceae bacterium]|jgi:cytidylate kinase|nr:cytidylate kinase-like family protein [Prevotellaceae bacterium]